MIHCAIAALSRDVPTEIRSNVLSSLHRLLSGPEMSKIAATRCLGSVQVYVLLSMCNDLNRPGGLGSEEVVWHNVGNAIRMAFGIVSTHSCPPEIGYSPLNARVDLSCIVDLSIAMNS